MTVAESPATVQEEIRAAMRRYREQTGILQSEYARRLGIAQSILSEFISPNATRRLQPRLARAAYRLHPELRPSLHAAVFGADAVAQTDAGEQVPA